LNFKIVLGNEWLIKEATLVLLHFLVLKGIIGRNPPRDGHLTLNGFKSVSNNTGYILTSMLSFGWLRERNLIQVVHIVSYFKENATPAKGGVIK